MEPSACSSRDPARLPLHLQQPSSSSTYDPEVFDSVHSIRPDQTFVSVQTLTKETFYIVVNAKTKLHDVLWKCGERLEIKEDKVFGLALRQPTEGIGGDQPRHEYYFLDPAARVVKYAPKMPRFSGWHNKSNESRPILVLYFRVRVYIEQVGVITCPRAKEHYYLQLKENFLDHWAGRDSVSEERCWYMAALALIADKGEEFTGNFRAEQYFPLWVINERGLEYIKNNLPGACTDLLREGREKAMEKFMVEAGRSPFALNCHLYGLRRHRMFSNDNAVLGINPRGIEMSDVTENGDRIPLQCLDWSKVTKLSFDRKKLTVVGADGNKLSLYAQTDYKAKYLLELCRSVHQTLLVMSHLYARMAPPPKPYMEMSVDGVSTSSTSGIGTGEHDKDTDSLSSAYDRAHGSISSRLRMRIKMDSNLDVKIEKMELEHIRQERAASQSSKNSEDSERFKCDRPSTSTFDSNTTPVETFRRTKSTDQVDVNFTVNCNAEGSTGETSNESTASSNTSQSVSLHDLRFNPRRLPSYEDHIKDRPQRSYSPQTQGDCWKAEEKKKMGSEALTRSEPNIDMEEWSRYANFTTADSATGPSSNGGRFVKKNSAGSRTTTSINRVHSMPSHYHVNVKHQPQIQNIEDIHQLQSNLVRPRNPPPYEFPVAQMSLGPPYRSLNGPLPAEAAGGQPSFPPASATPAQFGNVFKDDDGFSTEKIKDFRFLMMLWKDHRDNPTPIPRDAGKKRHQRRPSSSCIDLSDVGTTIVPPSHRSIDSVQLQKTLPHVAKSAIEQAEKQSTYNLPPPPPYPQQVN